MQERITDTRIVLCALDRWQSFGKLQEAAVDSAVQSQHVPWQRLRQHGEEDEEHGNSVKISITCITSVLQAILDFSQISLAFNMFSTLVLVKVNIGPCYNI